MFKWLARMFTTPITPTPEPKAPRRGGFFTTDAPTRPRRTGIDLAKTLARTFQKTITEQARGFGMDGAIVVAEDADVKAQFQRSNSSIPDSQLEWYASQGFIGYQACAMIAQHWLVDKACMMPGVDAVRNGYVVSADDGIELDAAVIDAIRDGDKAYKIQHEMEQFVHFGRVFGIRHALFVYDCEFDPDYYEKPFNPDSVRPGSYRGISQIDPYWITPELDGESVANPASRHFYQPTYWRISGKRYHRSHFVIMVDSEVPDILKPTYLYGGVSIPQKIYERVYASERVANEAPHLLLTKRATVIHVDMEKVVANPEVFEEKMGDWIYYRDNFGIKAVGEEEVIEQFDTTLTDVDTTIMTQYQIVAAIARVPATKLLGTSPKGFNATGEYEESNYHEELESVQTHDCQPLLERHHLMMMRSSIAPSFGIEPVKLNITWEPLDAPTAKEQAEVNLAKAQTGAALVASGAIDGTDERDRITADPSSGYSGLATLEDMDPEPLDDDELNDLIDKVLPNGEENTPAAN